MNVQFQICWTRGVLLALAFAGILPQLVAADATNEIPPGVTTVAARTAASGSLVGVTLAPGELPMAGVCIVIRNLAGGANGAIFSDNSGVFRAEDLQPGLYQITAFKEGVASSSAIPVEIEQGRVATRTIRLVADTGGQGAIGRMDSQPLTDREKRLLERIDRLEERLAAIEAKEGDDRLAALRPAERPQALSIAPVSASANQAPRTANAAPPQAPVEASNQAPQAVVPPAEPRPGSEPGAPPSVDIQTPFAFGDFTWLNGNPRNKDVVIDTPFFTPEVRFDTYFSQSFNQPVDHTMAGSTEEFRSGEFQVEQASVGGDFHWQDIRGRILTMFGMFSSTTPRNDPSPGNGQWDLRTAYRYISEAYGGYHFNVNHGLNIDAGIFVSYIGLFSYYNYDNWTYQPSYVSSNTPWFFNGMRAQWFPTNKLKFEPWIIDGWQSYARANGHHGFGGQILYRPNEWLSLVFNNYGNGTDTLGVPNRVRIHTDDSVEIRYYNNPQSTGLSKVAVSLTGDAGCEYGGGVTCHGGPGGPKQAFLGWMVYNRFWFHKDLFAITPGGGMMNNPGRYLTLLPPINGADAISGTPYFTENPGNKSHMWDTTLNFQYMPKQYITWWMEFGYRHSDVPYFSGRDGITPPGGNNGSPQYFVCNTGASSGTAILAAATTACGGPGSVWFPDLRRGQAALSAGVLVKF
jgi:hypothetical protein